MKISFFAKIYLAITDFRFYPYVVQKEKFINALAYFVCFILLMSVILTAGVSVKMLNWLDGFSEIYNEQVKDFAVSDGVLDMSENVEFDYNNVWIYTDDTKNIEDIDVYDLDVDDYDVSIIALKDCILVGNANVGFVMSDYSEFNIKMTKQDLYGALQQILSNIGFKLLLVFSVFGGVFVAYLLAKFINVLFVSFMLWLLGYMFRTKYKFKHYLEIAFYVVTLPIIIEVISIMAIGTITEYTYITYYLLLYVYMYYAIRALKLDHILTATKDKIFDRNVEDDSNLDMIDKDDKESNEEHSTEDDKKE